MLIVEKDPKSIVAENYKSIRTNIRYSSYDKPLKTLLITSSVMEEGKSVVASNLAFTLAEEGKKVLLVDCDLRRATVHKKLSLSNMVGLSEVILGIKNVDEAIQCYNEKIYVLTSGKIPPNPAEMIGSESMEKLLEFLKTKFDYIVLDCPPILPVTDAKILSSKVDGVVFVVRAGKTKKEEISKAVSALNVQGINLIGTILNAVKEDGREQYYYYGDNEEKAKKSRFKSSKH